MHVRFVVGAVLSMVAGFAVAAQSPFEALDAQGQFRGAVIDVVGGRVFAAVYDRNEIWVFAPDSRERLAQIPVGHGPAALALSANGSCLACANRLDSTVSLVRLPGADVYATLDVDEGPAAVAALSDGRFAVANSFADTVSLVDPRGDGSVSTIEEAAPVPVGLAASEGYLAVIGRASRALHLFPTGSGTASAVIALPDAPAGIVALPGNRFAVATLSELVLVDAESEKVLARRRMGAAALTAEANRLYVVSDSAVSRLDAALMEEERILLAGRASAVAVSGGVYVALSPKDKTWQVWNASGMTLSVRGPACEPAERSTEVVAAQSMEPARPGGPEVIEATPAVEKDGAPEAAARATEMSPAPPAAEATPEAAVPPSRSVEEGPAKEAEGQPVAALAPEAAPGEAAPGEAAETTEEEPLEATRMFRQHPIRTGGMRAPSPGSGMVSPFDPKTRGFIAETLVQPTEFGAPGSGFVQPDWTQPLRDVQAGKSRLELDTGRTLMQGEVQLRLGKMFFEADTFSYSQDLGDYHASGNVRIDQEASRVTADTINYVVAPDLELSPPSPFDAPLDEQEQAKRRLMLGHLDATNINIVEPTREMAASSVDYDFGTSTGELTDITGRAGPYYYGAAKLRLLGPERYEGEDVWVTTDPDCFKIRSKQVSVDKGVTVGGTGARLQLGRFNTPFFLPKWRRGGTGGTPWTIDFDSGRRAEIGYFVNVGQRFEVTPDWALGPRIYATEKEGLGLGLDVDYDLMANPASRLFRSKGELRTLYTTKDRGYVEWQHRYEYSNDLVVRMQAEQWGDSDFYKDFYYDFYRNRTAPRTFGNITYRRPAYLAAGTVRLNTHGWVNETERFPEATFHLLERPLFKNLYFSFDTINGYNDREPAGAHGLRTVNIARLTYNWDPLPALSVTPFWEAEGTWYSDERDSSNSATRFSNTTGVTLQTRFHKEYSGAFGFSAFKHVVVPSITYSYRPDSSLNVEEVPHFDSLDNVYGRSRIESKINNIVYGRNAETDEVWQVGRLTLYQGNDFWNATRKTDDYEIEVDLRPMPWWGLQMVGERHIVNDDLNLDDPFYIERTFLEWYERLVGRPYDEESEFQFNASYADYDRVLAQVYYDDTMHDVRFMGRLGFAYTRTFDRTFNREILYGMGFKVGEKWGIGFEHIYDIEDGDLRTQTYEIRRSLRCFETAVRVRDRESGFDIDFEINLKAFPGTRLRL